MNVVDQDGAESFFKGNSRQLNLQMQRERAQTTAAHEIGHMMGFRSSDPDDNTHFTDNSNFFGILPLMYSGKNPNLDQRVRTVADVQGLNIWQNKWQGDGYLGEEINSIIYEK